MYVGPPDPTPSKKPTSKLKSEAHCSANAAAPPSFQFGHVKMLASIEFGKSA